MDWTDSGGHKVEGEGQRIVEGNGASSSEKGMEEGYGARQGVRQGVIKAGVLGEGER